MELEAPPVDFWGPGRAWAKGCLPSEMQLRDYQLAVAYWLLTHPNQKGLLLRIDTGLGKTIIAANVAEVMYRVEWINKVIFIGPASLLKNFQKAIRLCRNNPQLPVYYEFYSYDRWRNRGLMSRFEPKTLIIVDESHEIRTPTSKKSKAVVAGCQHVGKVLLLSASPMVNNPDDLWPQFECLVPGIKQRVAQQTGFAPSTRNLLNNPHPQVTLAFHQEIMGQVAYLSGDNLGKPQVTEVRRMVQMNAEQIARIREVAGGQAAALSQALTSYIGQSGGSWKALNAFLGRSRQFANTINPDDSERIPGQPKKRKKIYHKANNIPLPPSQVMESICEPKILAIVEEVLQAPKPVIIHSGFRDHGIYKVRACLLKAGVQSNKIAYFYGDMDATNKGMVIDRYNNRLQLPENQRIDYLLYSKAGSVGISLKYTREVHIVEPHFNEALQEQAIARAVRIDSHTDLPENERHVRVVRWLSVAEGQPAAIQPDLHIYKMSQGKHARIREYDDVVLRNASIPMSRNELLELEARVGMPNPPIPPPPVPVPPPPPPLPSDAPPIIDLISGDTTESDPEPQQKKQRLRRIFPSDDERTETDEEPPEKRQRLETIEDLLDSLPQIPTHDLGRIRSSDEESTPEDLLELRRLMESGGVDLQEPDESDEADIDMDDESYEDEEGDLSEMDVADDYTEEEELTAEQQQQMLRDLYTRQANRRQEIQQYSDLWRQIREARLPDVPEELFRRE